MCSLAGRRLYWGSFLFFVMLGRLRDHRRRSRGSKGSVALPLPPASNRNLRAPPHVLGPKKLLRMYLTIPVDIGDRRTHIFCPQMGPKNYLRSTMKQDRLSNCLLMHCHKSITYTLETLRWCELRKYRFSIKIPAWSLDWLLQFKQLQS